MGLGKRLYIIIIVFQFDTCLDHAYTHTYYTTIAGDQVHSISPITPSELLIALHNIDCQEDEALMKAVIKGGSGCMCPFLTTCNYL